MNFIANMKSGRLAFVIFLLALPLTLTGCLSHWFIESESRLQVENAADDYTILSVGVVAMDGSLYSPWIKEKILPGERSRVVEGDWVGEFKLRINYTESKDGSGDTLTDYQMFDLEGGSLFLMVEASGDSLKYRFR